MLTKGYFYALILCFYALSARGETTCANATAHSLLEKIAERKTIVSELRQEQLADVNLLEEKLRAKKAANFLANLGIMRGESFYRPTKESLPPAMIEKAASVQEFSYLVLAESQNWNAAYSAIEKNAALALGLIKLHGIDLTGSNKLNALETIYEISLRKFFLRDDELLRLQQYENLAWNLCNNKSNAD